MARLLLATGPMPTRAAPLFLVTAARRWGLAALVLAACGTPANPADAPDADAPDAAPTTATPTLEGATGYLAGTTTFVIAGELAGGAPAVDLGADIVIDRVDVVGAGRAEVTLSVSPVASIGPRDVTIAVPGHTWRLPASFTVKPSLAATISGSPMQGGMIGVELASLRPDVPLWTAPFYIGRDLLGVPDSGDRTNRWFLVAPGAAIGPTHLTWSLSRAGAGDLATEPGALTITAQVPVALVPGVSATGDMAPLQTALRRVPVDGDAIYLLSASGPGRPRLWLFGDRAGPDDVVANRAAESDLRHPNPTVELEIPGRGDPLTLVAHHAAPHAAGPSIDLALEAIPAAHLTPGPGHATVDTALDIAACGTACVITGRLAPGERHVLVLPAGSRVDPELPFFAALSLNIVADSPPSVTEIQPRSGRRNQVLAGDRRVIPRRALLDDTPSQARIFEVRGWDDETTSYRLSIRSVAWR